MPSQVMDHRRAPSLCAPPVASSFFSEEIRFPAQRKAGIWKSASQPDSLFATNDGLFNHSATTFNTEEDELFGSLKEIEARTIGDLLPDDDELLSDVIFEREKVAPRNNIDDAEDDLFYSVGGLELETSVGCNGKRSNTNGSFGGHSHGEQASRTLFVRNINSNVQDSDLRVLFEQYGDIRTLYTACKHRGFAMISYYDVRSACCAMRALQNRQFMHEKLDVHFSILKENSTWKDINEATLVVLNLDQSVSNEDLCQIFSVYGEIKELSELPHKKHHKFIEFYDVRAAEAAHCALNLSGFAGKQIMLECSRPGDTRCLMQQLSRELEQQEGNACHKRCSPNSSPSLNYGVMPFGPITSNGLDHGVVQSPVPVSRGQTSLLMENGSTGISPTVPRYLSSPVNVTSVGNHTSQSGTDDLRNSLGRMSLGFHQAPRFHPHSLPEYHDALGNSITCNSPNTMSSLALNAPVLSEGIDKMHISGGSSAFGALRNSSASQGYQYGLNNSNLHHHLPPSPSMWPSSPSLVNNIPLPSPSQLHGFSRASPNMLNSGMHLPHHHVGSAPTGNPSLWERRHAFERNLKEANAVHQCSLENMGLSNTSRLYPLDFASPVFHTGGKFMEPSVTSTLVGLTSPQQRCHMFPGGRNSMIPSPSDRVRSRRSASPNQTDNKKHYELDIERIIRGEDSRTTLMIKNIPNKYTSKMLLAAIDENHRGTYDFIYLPIDFKNKCNVGYAFINIIDPQQIIPFYKAFNGKRWEKFNSEKVASLAYARIQGKAALIAHFQNSSLMNEDKRCRPILFHSDGPNAGDQEPFPVGSNIRSRSGRLRTQNNEDSNQGSPSDSSGEETSHDSHSSADSVDS